MTEHESDPWWRSTWPMHRDRWVRLVALLIAVIGVGSLVGLLLTDWLHPNGITDLDERLAERLAADRTPTRTDLASVGAMLADTPVKIGVTAIVVALMLWRWKRCHEALFVAVSLIFEATAFIVITAVVQRPRPAVSRLLDSPVDSSFPSGHVAAATVYGAFAVVVFWRTWTTWAWALAVVVFAPLPVIVGLSRMYQGMHYLTDVLGGVVLGGVSLTACGLVLGRPLDIVRPAEPERASVRALTPVAAGERVAP